MKKTQNKNMKKRILSAALAMGMVLTMFPYDAVQAVAKKVVSNAATGDVTYEYNNYSNTKTVIRERKAWKEASVISVTRTAEKGSIENPYVILEVVPYKDYSSIGYLVDGCEPINMDSLCGNKLVIDTLTGSDGDFFGFGKFEKPYGSIYFFPDETEGNQYFYQNTNLTNEEVTIDGVTIAPHESALRFTSDQWEAKEVTTAGSVYGYYEVVPKGEGTFILKTESTDDGLGGTVMTRSIVKADDSNKSETTLVWHTMNDYLKDQYLDANRSNRFFQMSNLNNPLAFPLLMIDYEEDPDYVGNRFYTQRTYDAEDHLHDVTGDFYVYKSEDLFARNTLGLSPAQAQNCSITVKTITPYELDKNQGWLEIADLIYFNADLTTYVEVSGSDTEGKDDNEAGLVDLWRSTVLEFGTANKTYMNRFHYGNCLDADGNPEDSSKMGFRGTYEFSRIPKMGPYNSNTSLKDEANYYPTGTTGLSRELTLEVFYKILEKVSRTDNYLAVIFDQTCTDPAYNDMSSANISYHLFSYGDNQASRKRLVENSTYGEKGYLTNVAKLWLACTSVNPGFAKRFFIDNGAASNHGQIEADGNKNIIYKNNARTNMPENERKYWSGYTFYCSDEDYYVDSEDNSTYWKNYAGDVKHSQDCYFVQAHVFVTPYKQNLVENYAKPYDNDDLAFAAGRYLDFNEFLETYGGTNSRKANVATSSLATKYILDVDKVVNYYLDELTVLDVEPSVKMASVSRKGDNAYEWKFDTADVIKLIPKRLGSQTRVKPIVHQVMQSFIAKNEDLNSTYDLIYFGDDAGGFWTGDEVKATYYNGSSRDDRNYISNHAKAGGSRTDFVDDNMDGLVYFHVGDTLNVASSGTKAYNYVNDAAVFGESSYTRQAGNDLTDKKRLKLLDYLNADYPIVIADNLYPGNWGTTGANRPYVQAGSIMYKFVTDSDPENHKDASGNYSDCYFTKDNLEQIDKMISNRMKGRVSIDETPITYDTNRTMGRIYLEDNGGYASLHFKVTVPNTTDYMYRVFVDRNRDSNFTYDPSDDEKNEVITGGYKSLTSLVNDFSVAMPDKWVGFVQWRIEVVNRNNSAKRYSKEGCSAVAAQAGADPTSDRAKKKIVALQIMPTHGSQGDHKNTSSWVDLSNRNLNGTTKTNDTWQSLYTQVNDFDIEVVSITWRQFNQLFKPQAADQKVFKFNMGADINVVAGDAGNPNMDTLNRVEQTPLYFYTSNSGGHKKDELRAVTGSSDNYYKLDDFNMIVLGFDDAFGLTDMSNEYGCVEYLYYFALKGCSILFTHDTTSQHSDKNKTAHELGWVTLDNERSTWHEYRAFGYTGNNMMREIMGMNRYMQYSKNITGATRDTETAVNFRTDLKENIAAYVTRHVKYDQYTSGFDGLQGFSTFNMLRYVCANANGNDGKSGRVQYKYMVKNPSNNNTVFRNGGTYDIDGAPYNNVTEIVTMINEGQITQYPFTIGDGSGEGRQKQFRIGETHGQWWQLNMEDEDLTVWYTLDDPATSTLNIGSNDYLTNRKDRNGRNALIYSAVPYDAANNFYIFSKGNIFYSGVGHSALVTETQDSNQYERKLFVNTLVAAYRPKFGLPFVQVTNTEASLLESVPTRKYGISLPVDYGYNPTTGSVDWSTSEIIVGSGSTDLVSNGNIIVKFRPMDNNGCTTIYTYVRYAQDGGAALAVYDSLASAQSGSAMSPSHNVVFHDGHSENYYVLEVGREYYLRFPKDNLFGSSNTVLFRSYNNRITTEERSETTLEFKTHPLFNLD